MINELKKLTFVITPEMEILLNRFKKERFYNCSQSEMIRTLVEIGYDATQSQNRHAASKHAADS